MKYIRFNEDSTIGFLDDSVNLITKVDIAIKDEVYNQLIKLQEDGERLSHDLFNEGRIKLMF